MVQGSFVTVEQGRARGQIRVPTSKSIAHRALICAALADGESVLSGVPCNEDVDATLDCLAALGVSTRVESDPEDGDARRVTVRGCRGVFASTGQPLRCRESGSTLRFMLPLCLLSEEGRTLLGSTRLLERPLNDYHALFAAREWVQLSNELQIGGGSVPKGRVFRLAGKSSSQFVTGLLHILPLLEGESRIALEAPPESRSYIDMTLAVMARFGVHGEWVSDTDIVVSGGQRYRSVDMTVDADASGAAFFEALTALGHDVRVANGGGKDIVQGDSVCPAMLERMKSATGACVLSLADCPDLGPVLFAAAAALVQRSGQAVVFTHTARLRLKESDRIDAMVGELKKLGADVVTSEQPREEQSRAALASGLPLEAWSEAKNGYVAVLPTAHGLHAPEEVLDGHNDHRVVMALSVLLCHVGGGRISDACAVRKSFPAFFDRLRALGVRVTGDM